MNAADRADLEEMLRGWCFEPCDDATPQAFCTRRRWHQGAHRHNTREGKRYVALVAALASEHRNRPPTQV